MTLAESSDEDVGEQHTDEQADLNVTVFQNKHVSQ
jgi:hypothetical protein